jgi:release factor glutamine methyltransferase
VTQTVSAALAEIAQRLRQAGIESPRREARLLVGHVLGIGPEAIIAGPERSLTVAESDRLAESAGRRVRREPLSHILGWREFWSLPFRVTAETLDPRPDSETLVEAALDCIADPVLPVRILDLGSGTGCLLLAVLSERPHATGIGVDRNPGAVEIARANAAKLGLADRAVFASGDWGKGLDEVFHLILTNPPYIPVTEIHGLAPEVALYEPRLALAGGPDGLDCYRAIAPDLHRLLKKGGHAVVEVGLGQADKVQGILAAVGLRPLRRAHDLSGVERCLVFERE